MFCSIFFWGRLIYKPNCSFYVKQDNFRPEVRVHGMEWNFCGLELCVVCAFDSRVCESLCDCFSEGVCVCVFTISSKLNDKLFAHFFLP